MDQQGHGQAQGMNTVNTSAQMPYTMPPYPPPNQMMGIVPPAPGQPSQTSGLPSPPAQLAQQQLAYQHIHQQQQQQLHQQLQNFWANQYQEIEQTTDFKNHSLPLARIKKIMKADEDVRMISAEAPVIFARACEMFILELTLRSWNHTEENKRRTLQKNDIAAAITRTDIFDFLVDIVPREDLKDEVIASTIPRGGPLPVGGPTEGLPYYYMPPPQGCIWGSRWILRRCMDSSLGLIWLSLCGLNSNNRSLQKMLELNTGTKLGTKPVKKETLKMVGVDEGRRVDILSVKFSHVVMVLEISKLMAIARGMLLSPLMHDFDLLSGHLEDVSNDNCIVSIPNLIKDLNIYSTITSM
uniref:Core Histone H2A/H2B/H3 domain-containing protein n=1 Tax=Lactuca sativa TaxID=4236 RepID=A0A9R1VI20_LACSA|nr:hypothetical protein LSAT_V11C500256270 [Lactuca sativa]